MPPPRVFWCPVRAACVRPGEFFTVANGDSVSPTGSPAPALGRRPRHPASNGPMARKNRSIGSCCPPRAYTRPGAVAWTGEPDKMVLTNVQMFIVRLRQALECGTDSSSSQFVIAFIYGKEGHQMARVNLSLETRRIPASSHSSELRDRRYATPKVSRDPHRTNERIQCSVYSGTYGAPAIVDRTLAPPRIIRNNGWLG